MVAILYAPIGYMGSSIEQGNFSTYIRHLHAYIPISDSRLNTHQSLNAMSFFTRKPKTPSSTHGGRELVLYERPPRTTAARSDASSAAPSSRALSSVAPASVMGPGVPRSDYSQSRGSVGSSNVHSRRGPDNGPLWMVSEETTETDWVDGVAVDSRLVNSRHAVLPQSAIPQDLLQQYSAAVAAQSANAHSAIDYDRATQAPSGYSLHPRPRSSTDEGTRTGLSSSHPRPRPSASQASPSTASSVPTAVESWVSAQSMTANKAPASEVSTGGRSARSGVTDRTIGVNSSISHQSYRPRQNKSSSTPRPPSDSKKDGRYRPAR